MKKFGLLLSAAFVMALPGAAQAETITYNFDQPHTQVLFFVDHMGFAKSQGEFEQTDGTITINEEEPEKSVVDVSIPIASLDMDDAKWEEHLKSADFFDAAQFPVMTFKSTSVERTGENTANVTGDLTIHGVTKPTVLAVTHNKSGKHPMKGNNVTGFSATTNIKRSDFGMEYGLPMVGDDVEIRLEVEAHEADPSGTNTGNE